jgi:hypothetical protein
MLIPPGFLSPAFEPDYYIAGLSGSTKDVRSISVDSANNVIFASYASGNIFLVKTDKYGEIIWQKTISYNTENVILRLDSSNNIYLLLDATSSGGPLGYAKLDSSGSVVFRKQLTHSYSEISIEDFKLTPSGTAYFTGSLVVSSVRRGFVAKLTSSGSFSWGSDFVNLQVRALSSLGIDSSENVYMSSSIQDSIYNFKFNSSGSYLSTYATTIPGDSGTIHYTKTITTSSGDTYVASNRTASSVNKFLLIKYASNNTITWAREVNITGIPTNINVDSSGNVLVIFNNQYIIRFNSAGTTILSREVTTASGATWRSISTDSSNNPIFAGRLGAVSFTSNWVKIPSDGSKTGTYTFNSVSVTYSNPGLNAFDISLTPVEQGNLSTNAVSLSSSDASFSVTNASFTTQVTEIV